MDLFEDERAYKLACELISKYGVNDLFADIIPNLEEAIVVAKTIAERCGYDLDSCKKVPKPPMLRSTINDGLIDLFRK